METWVIILPTCSLAKTDRREVRKAREQGRQLDGACMKRIL